MRKPPYVFEHQTGLVRIFRLPAGEVAGNLDEFVPGHKIHGEQ